MSLVYQVQSVHFAQDQWEDKEKRSQWLADRHLKSKFSNLKTEGGQLINGNYVYKQRSGEGGKNYLDKTQSVVVSLGDSVYATGVYRYAKFKKPRSKRAKAEPVPEVAMEE